VLFIHNGGRLNGQQVPRSQPAHPPACRNLIQLTIAPNAQNLFGSHSRNALTPDFHFPSSVLGMLSSLVDY